jgi:anti-repressor protein
MTNQLAVFRYQDTQVRTVTDEQGEPWFVAKDVCEVLDLGDVSKAVSRLPQSMKGTNSILTPGGHQDMLIVTEAGLYKLIFTSRKPEAEAFTDWVVEEVLPSIRKHGIYATPSTVEAMLNDPDVMIQALTALKDERAKRVALEEERKALIPKAEFFDSVADSKDAVDMGRVAKVLNCGIGRNRLFALLRDKGILMSNNTPYQGLLDRGYFRVIEQKYSKPDGSTHISFRTLVYQRGLEFIRRTVQDSKRTS